MKKVGNKLDETRDILILVNALSNISQTSARVHVIRCTYFKCLHVC